MSLNQLSVTSFREKFVERSTTLKTNTSPLTTDKQILMLNVKWKGYDDPSDQTLEPEEGLLYEDCPI